MSKDTYGTTKRIEVLDGDLELDAKTESVKIIGTTNSSTSSTGSLVVSGGVGIAKDLYVDGNITGGSFSGEISSSTILADSVTGNCHLDLSSGSGAGCDVNINADEDVKINTTAGGVIVNAADDVNINAARAVYINATDDIFLDTAGTVLLDSDVILLRAVDNIRLTSNINDVEIDATRNANISAANDIILNADNDITLNTDTNFITISENNTGINSTSGSIFLNSDSGNVNINADVDILLNATDDILLTADDKFITISENDTGINSTSGSIFLNSDSDNINLNAYGDIVLNATDDILLTADDKFITISENDTGINSTSGSIFLNAYGDINLNAGVGGNIHIRNETVVESGEVSFEIERAYFYGTGETANAYLSRNYSGITPRFQIHEDGDAQATFMISKNHSSSDDTYVVFVDVDASSASITGRIRGSNSSGDNAFVSIGGGAEVFDTSYDTYLLTFGVGNVVYASGNADFGEWVECGDVSEWKEYEKRENKNLPNQVCLPEGIVVKIRNKKFYKDGSGCAALVTNSALLVGNEIQRSDDWHGVIISFAGQIHVFIEGPCKSGDYIVPKQNENFCIAIDKDEISFSDYKNALGTVLEDSDVNEIKHILCAIGIK